MSQPKSHKCLKKKLDNFSNLFVKISKLRCEDAVSLTIICERCEACQGGSCGQRRDIKEDPAVSRQSAWPPLKMIKTLLVCFLLYSQAFASPVPAEDTEAEEMVDRGLVEDLLIGMIRDLVINQINAILGITTTTTPCTGLVGGGLLCPPVK